MSAASQLLGRLTGVRQTAPDRWIARCPSHEDRSPSLAIRELPDGKVLLHDFGGCSAVDVLHALGLELSDLFDRPRDPGDTSHGRRLRVPAADLILMLDHEATVLAIAAADFLEHRELDEETWNRLATASRRIGWCADHIREGSR